MSLAAIGDSGKDNGQACWFTGPTKFVGLGLNIELSEANLMMRSAFMTGITGQDGSYLAQKTAPRGSHSVR